jgi:hypothetical protein
MEQIGTAMDGLHATPGKRGSERQRRAKPSDSYSHRTRSSHRVYHPSLQVAESRPVDVRTQDDQVSTRNKVPRRYRGYRPETSSPTIPNDRTSNLPTDGESHTGNAVAFVRRSEVYSDSTRASSAARLTQLSECSPASYRRRPTAQAERFTRPRLRRAFRIARPARVDIRCRKP